MSGRELEADAPLAWAAALPGANTSALQVRALAWKCERASEVAVECAALIESGPTIGLGREFTGRGFALSSAMNGELVSRPVFAVREAIRLEPAAMLKTALFTLDVAVQLLDRGVSNRRPAMSFADSALWRAVDAWGLFQLLEQRAREERAALNGASSSAEGGA